MLVRSSLRALVALALLVGCRSAPMSVLLEVRAEPAVGPLDELRLDLYEPGLVAVGGQRLPAAGAPQLPATVVLYPPRSGVWLAIRVRGLRASATVAEGVATVVTRDREQAQASVVLAPGRLPDRDGDGVPDLIDSCPTLPNPAQGPCPGTDARPDLARDRGPADVPRDAARDRAVERAHDRSADRPRDQKAERPRDSKPPLDLALKDGSLPGCVAYAQGIRSYQLCSTKTWAAAAAACAAAGYELARIDDATENAWLLAIAKALWPGSTPGSVWLGGSDQNLEGTWTWTDGAIFYQASAPVLFTTWGTGEPNNMGEEDCLELRLAPLGANLAGDWNDTSCADVLPYVCRR